ncbi:MAG: hypothetical protein Q3M30_19080 [Candidatus Electrothrix sp. Rat3]|nr:hypothetical protein [Candidatus Electrothrix rattekaaiensis]
MRRPAIVASGARSLFELLERPARRPINSGITTINKSKNKSVFIIGKEDKKRVPHNDLSALIGRAIIPIGAITRQYFCRTCVVLLLLDCRFWRR